MNCHGDQRVRCKDQRITEHTRHNRALLYNALGKIESTAVNFDLIWLHAQWHIEHSSTL